MTPPRYHDRVSIEAPAKLNLGLEILDRRPDGYHDLVTILQAIDLVDELTLAPAQDVRIVCDDPSLAGSDNLALAALTRLRAHLGSCDGVDLRLRKGIPVAAGLGGASSDAAAALLAARHLWHAPISDADLATIAAALGSDVPFFLRGGTALATGRGDRLESLPIPIPVCFVVVSPALVLPRKTAGLYAALRPTDFTSGEAVRAQADRLRGGVAPDPGLLENAFTRPLYALRPELAELPAVMRAAGAPNVALSGAGPTHYALMTDREAANRAATAIAARLGPTARVTVAAPSAKPPTPVAT